MIKIKEARKLLDIIIIYDKHLNCFTLNHQGESKIFFGDEDSFRLFLRKYKFIDNLEEPKSYRAKTYKQMVDDIVNKVDNIVMCWSNIWDKIPYRLYQKESKNND